MKIRAKANQNIYFTSDTHFGHTNICRGVSQWGGKSKTRDFDTLDQMNDAIVNGINFRVGEDDILIHTGDWSFGGYENIPLFRSRIVCKNVYLIYGNHDDHIMNNKNNYQDLFTFTHPGNLLVNIGIEGHGCIGGVNRTFVLNHYPLASWRDMKKGVIQLHGHVHLEPNHKLSKGKAMDIGVDGNNLNPYSFMEIVKIMDKQPIDMLTLPTDHHLDGDKTKQ